MYKYTFLILTNISVVLHILLDCKRLWLRKSTETFATIKTVFFYLVFTPRNLAFGL